MLLLQRRMHGISSFLGESVVSGPEACDGSNPQEQQLERNSKRERHRRHCHSRCVMALRLPDDALRDLDQTLLQHRSGGTQTLQSTRRAFGHQAKRGGVP